MPTRRQVLRGVGGGLAAGLAGCLRAPRAAASLDPLAETSLDERASAQLQGGPRNRGYVDATVPESVTVDWSLPVNRGEHTAAKSTPVATPDGDVVIAADTGEIRRVTSEKKVRWTASVDPTSRGIHGTPAIANDTAYVGAYDGALYAFDLATGERRWKTRLGDAIGSSPVYYNGICYVAVEYHDPSGSVAAVDAASGDVRWIDYRPTDHPHSTIGLARDAGRLVVGSNDGTCYAWSFPDLERAWTFETEGAIKGPVAIHDGLAIFGSWDHRVYGVDLADGTERWRYDAGDMVMSGPAVDPDGTVYVGSHDNAVTALDAASGREQWRFTASGYFIGALTATREHVLAGSGDTSFYAIEKATGENAWHATGRGYATSAALVGEDAIYYAERATDTQPGQLYRLVER